MSFQVDSICYDTEQDALSVMASRMFGTAYTPDGVYQYSSYVDGLQIITQTSLNTQTSISPVLQQCQLFSMEESSVWSLAIMVILVAAFKFKVASRVANGSINE